MQFRLYKYLPIKILTGINNVATNKTRRGIHVKLYAVERIQEASDTDISYELKDRYMLCLFIHFQIKHKVHWPLRAK